MSNGVLSQFDPPAFLDDFNEQQKAAWSRFISDAEDSEIRPLDGIRFYNPTRTPTDDDQQTLDIEWTGFPRRVQISSSTDRIRWSRADASRDAQDEYLEWSVERDAQTRKITKVTFTCEGPEYWRFLGQSNPDLVLQLYRQHISTDVQQSDLFDITGGYIARNRWNSTTTGGAMHLVQRNNTLLAEINISARSTIVRFINGRVLTGERELIDCGRYGDPERFSDPHIGGEVNKLARMDADITIANPVALYINGLSTNGWEAPDSSDPQPFWRVTRGTLDHTVRAVYEVPTDRDFVVGDIKINSVPIDFGAQIADLVTMRVTGLACRFGQSTVPRTTTCAGFFGLAAASPAIQPVDDFRDPSASNLRA